MADTTPPAAAAPRAAPTAALALSVQSSGTEIKSFLESHSNSSVSSLARYWNTDVSGYDLIKPILEGKMSLFRDAVDIALESCGIDSRILYNRVKGALNGIEIRDPNDGVNVVSRGAVQLGPVSSSTAKRVAWPLLLSGSANAAKRSARSLSEDLRQKYRQEGYTLSVTKPGNLQAHHIWFDEDPCRICAELGLEFNGTGVKVSLPQSHCRTASYTLSDSCRRPQSDARLAHIF